MKQTIFTLFVGLFASFSSLAQWTQLISGTTKDLNSVSFVNDTTGWVCGKDGIIKHTSNGGTSWTNQLVATSEDLNDIFFADALNGWCVGKDGMIFHTSNGGVNWNTQISNTVFELYAVHFLDAQFGMAAGEAGVILKTIDGGMNWTISAAGTGGSGSGSESETEINDIQVVSSSTAYVCGKDGYFAKTINAGTSWIVQTTAISDDFEAFHFPSAGTGFIAYNDGKVKRTDGLGNFTSVYAATSKDLKGVWFISNTRGWVVGKEGRILLTNDAGTSWSSHNITSVTSELTDVTFPSPNTGYIVGDDGRILKLSNGTIASVTENTLSFSLYPNPAEDFLIINTEAVNPQFSITDLNGKVLIQTTSPQISLSNLTAGTYFVQVLSEGIVSTQKIIKR